VRLLVSRSSVIGELWNSGLINDQELRDVLNMRFYPEAVFEDRKVGLHFFLRIFEQASDRPLLSSSMFRLNQLSAVLSKEEKLRIRLRLQALQKNGKYAGLAENSTGLRDLFELSRNSSRLPALVFECREGLKTIFKALLLCSKSYLAGFSAKKS